VHDVPLFDQPQSAWMVVPPSQVAEQLQPKGPIAEQPVALQPLPPPPLVEVAAVWVPCVGAPPVPPTPLPLAVVVLTAMTVDVAS
jgi:hypothetical protein